MGYLCSKTKTRDCPGKQVTWTITSNISEIKSENLAINIICVLLTLEKNLIISFSEYSILNIPSILGTVSKLILSNKFLDFEILIDNQHLRRTQKQSSNYFGTHKKNTKFIF